MTLPAGLKPPRAVLFDWDNTLVNTWPTIVECYHDAFFIASTSSGWSHCPAPPPCWRAATSSVAMSRS